MVDQISRRRFLLHSGAALAVPPTLSGQAPLPLSQAASGCVFCGIVTNAAPARKLWEDDQFLAFLDIKPINPGHTLLIPKQHFEYIFELGEPLYSRMFQRAKRLAAPIKLAMEAKRIGMMVEGFGVAHLHIHLVPINKGGQLITRGVAGVTQEEFARVSEKIRAQIRKAK